MVAAMIEQQTRSRRPQSAAGTPGERVDFGFREVAAAEKAGLVRQVFDSVAPRYDLMNDLMSLGIHRLWKSRFLDVLAPRAERRLVDVAGGTGDITLGWRERGGGPVLAVDINYAMLSVGRDRAIDRGVLQGVDWVTGDAEALPVVRRSMDVYSIAFGLRNVTHIERALAEAHRVLKPGGRVAILEFSPMAPGLLKEVYDRYSFTVLPALGRLIAGDSEAYRYLAESIRRFPPADRLAAMMRETGFAGVSIERLSGGIAVIHSARRV